MNEEIIKKLGRDMRLDAYLDSIKECSDVACGYISGEYEINDVEELVTTLACIPQYVEEIEKIILEMAEEYEKEIEELKYEQL